MTRGSCICLSPPQPCSRSRKKMQNVSNLSILTMLIMYMLSALFGYLTFYGKEKIVQLHQKRERNICLTTPPPPSPPSLSLHR